MSSDDRDKREIELRISSMVERAGAANRSGDETTDLALALVRALSDYLREGLALAPDVVGAIEVQTAPPFLEERRETLRKSLEIAESQVVTVSTTARSSIHPEIVDGVATGLHSLSLQAELLAARLRLRLLWEDARGSRDDL